MVTADVVDQYPSISHDAGLEALRKAHDNGENKKIHLMTLPKWQNLI